MKYSPKVLNESAANGVVWYGVVPGRFAISKLALQGLHDRDRRINRASVVDGEQEGCAASRSFAHREEVRPMRVAFPRPSPAILTLLLPHLTAKPPTLVLDPLDPSTRWAATSCLSGATTPQRCLQRRSAVDTNTRYPVATIPRRWSRGAHCPQRSFRPPLVSRD